MAVARDRELSPAIDQGDETVDGDDVCCAGFHKGLWHLGASATMGAQNELDEQRCLYLGSLKYPYNIVGYARTG